MKPRVTFTINGPAVGNLLLLEKIRGFADELEEFIKSHTIINRDNSEYRSWLINVPSTDNSSITCLLSRQNDSETSVGFGFVLSHEDKVPDAKKVVAYLYPEFV